MKKKSHGGYCIGSDIDLSSDSLEKIIAEIASSDVGERSLATLQGRTSVRIFNLPETGSVVMKSYHRGGAFSKVIKDLYLRFGKCRALKEFQCLHDALSGGVHVPKPIAYIQKGKVFYKNWLITAEIKAATSLVNYNREDHKRLRETISLVAKEVSKLIDLGIWHIDLHPGNVLITEAGEVYLIDFDKARRYRGHRKSLRDKYICRWRRAVQKHELDNSIFELFALGLRGKSGAQA